MMAAFLEYRTYHGSAMGLPIQHASIAAWDDEEHVRLNQALYQQKFDLFVGKLQAAYEISIPDASFYVWLKVPNGDDVAFTQRLWQTQGVQVLPGRCWRETRLRAILAKAMCALPWWRQWKSANKQPNACSHLHSVVFNLF
jgi:aspartate/methionine/tyrosine aminotransferase